MTFAVQMWGSAINLNTSQCHISNVSTGCLFLTGFTQIRISDDCMTTIENIIKCQEITPTPLLRDHSYITSSHFWAPLPPPLRQHVFSTKNKQKSAFSDPPPPLQVLT